MLRDEIKTMEMASAVNERGVFVVGFTFPVVPKGEARIRVQIMSEHTRDHLDLALSIFETAGKELGII
jgi:glycine C-acetyltransferase